MKRQLLSFCVMTLLAVIIAFSGFGQSKSERGTASPFSLDGQYRSTPPGKQIPSPNRDITILNYSTALPAGADRLVALQNLDGGWDWPLNDGNPGSVSPLNTVGPIAKGLAEAYFYSHSAERLAAITKAATLLMSKTNNFSPSDGYLAAVLDEVFNVTTYTTYVNANYYGPLAAGTYNRNGAGTLYSTQSYIDMIRNSRSGSQANMAAWDIGTGLVGAASCGVSGTELGYWITGTEAEINELDGDNNYDVLGLAGALYGLAYVGEEFDPTAGEHASASSLADLAATLASYQINMGGFAWNSDWVKINDGDEAIQETSYAILALNSVDRTTYLNRIHSAADYMISVQKITGGWSNYQAPNGPPYTDENNEVTGEALWGITTAYLPFYNSTDGVCYETLSDAIGGASNGDVIDVEPGTYSGMTFSSGASVTLTNTSGGTVTFYGASPALTVSSGTLTVNGISYTNATDAPTILVEGTGNLIMRNCTIEESTAYDQTGILVTGGSLDAGTSLDHGQNTFITDAGGLAVTQTGGTATAVGNYWGTILGGAIQGLISGTVPHDPWCNSTFSTCGYTTSGGPITYAPTVYSPAGTFTVPIRVTRFNDVNSISLKMGYTNLTFVSGRMGPNVPQADSIITAVDGKVVISYFRNAGFNLSDNDAVALITFTYNGVGDASLTWTESDPTGTDLEYQNATIQAPYDDTPIENYYIAGYIKPNTGKILFTRDYNGYPVGSTVEKITAVPSAGDSPYDYSWIGPSAFTQVGNPCLPPTTSGYGPYTVTAVASDWIIVRGIYNYDRVHNVISGLDYHDIQAAINSGSTANTGHTLVCDPGTYIERVDITKELTILGAQYDVDPVTRAAAFVAGKADPAFESIILAHTNAPDLSTSDLVYLGANNIILKGFTLDGNNPALGASTYQLEGLDLHARRGISNWSNSTFMSNNTDIAYNVIQNVANRCISFAGLNSGWNQKLSGNKVRKNYLRNFGYAGVYMTFNAYTDVTDNTIYTTDIQQFLTGGGQGIGTFTFSNIGGTCTISGNNVTVPNVALVANLINPGSSPAVISYTNNVINALSTGCEMGFQISSILAANSGNTVICTGNTIGANPSSGEFEAGYYVFGNSTPTTVSITGGSVAHAANGVIHIVDHTYGWPANSILNVSNLSIDASLNGVLIQGTLLTGTGTVQTNLSGLTINSEETGIYVTGENAAYPASLNLAPGCTVNGGITGLRMEGPAATIVGGTLNNLAFTGQSGNYIELISNAGNIDATSVTFDGITGALPTTLDQNFGIEDKIVHKIDNSALGFVLVKALNDFVTPNSFISPATTTPSIQRGIDAAGTPGWTVNVKAGGSTLPYLESNLLIDKSLTLLGQSRDNVIIGPSSADVGIGWNATDGTPQTGLTIAANDVTIKNLTIDGQANPSLSGNNYRHGIYHYATPSNISGLLIQNVNVYHIRRRGISIGGTSLLNPVTITGCKVEDVSYSHGIRVESAKAIITDNTINDVSVAISVAQTASDPDPDATATITGNIIHNLGHVFIDGAIYGNVGIYYRNPNDDRKVIIQDNEITGAAVANTAVGLYLYNTNNASVISDNTIDLSAIDYTTETLYWGYSYGVYLGGCAGTTLSDNIITMSRKGTGVYLGRGASTTPVPNYVLRNTISSTNAVSVVTGESSGIFSTSDITYDIIGEDPQNTDNIIENNFIKGFINDVLFVEGAIYNVNASINGNSITPYGLLGLDASDLTRTTIEATCNWWGTSSVSGVASAVSGPVTYEPWLTNGTDNDLDPANGFQPVPYSCNGMVDYYVNNAYVPADDHYTTAAGSDVSGTGTSNNPYATLGYAVSKAVVGAEKVFVDAGTYNETALVDKTLDIRGSNYGISPNGETRLAESVIDGGGSGGAIPVTITANDVLFNGFTVQNSGLTGVEAGIGVLNLITPITGCYVDKNIVTDNLAGIAIQNGTNNFIRDNKLTLNYWGVYLGDDINPSTGNTVSGNDIATSIYQQLGPQTFSGDGIYADQNCDGNTFTGNYVHDNKQNGFYFWKSGGNTVNLNNIVEDNEDSGLGLFGSDGNNISDNIISGNLVGIKIRYSGTYPVTNNTIGCNTISATTNGIYIEEGCTGTGITNNTISSTGLVSTGITTYEALTGVTGNIIGPCPVGIETWKALTANTNKFTGTMTYAMVFHDNYARNVINNWWNSTDGPKAWLNGLNENTFNQLTQGYDLQANTFSNFTFAPWLTSGTDADGETCGFQQTANFAPVYANSTNDATETEQYGSIHAAVTTTALPYVFAKEGSFTEQVTINKSLTLTGAGRDKTWITPLSTRSSVSAGGWVWDYVMAAYATSGTIDVRIQKVAISGNGYQKTPGTNYYAGLFLKDVNGTTAGLYNSYIFGFSAAYEYESYGIKVYGNSSLTINGNLIQQYTRDGISVDGGTATVSYNEVNGSGVPLNGINIGASAVGGSIIHNSVKDHTRSAPWAGYGILAWSNNILVDDNDVTNCYDGIGVQGHVLPGAAVSGVTVSNNTLSGIMDHGIILQNASACNVRNNTFGSAAATLNAAILINEESTGNTIGGTTYANSIDIPVSGTGNLHGIHLANGLGSGSNTISYNTIDGGTVALWQDGGTTGTTTVTNNTIGGTTSPVTAGLYFDSGTLDVKANNITLAGTGNQGIFMNNACGTGSVIGGDIALDGNTITMPGSGIGTLYGIQLGGADAAPNFTIKNNVITGGQRGVQIDGPQTTGGGTMSISYNTISNAVYGGIISYNKKDMAISYNLLTNNGRPIELLNATSVDVNHNEINGATYSGIVVSTKVTGTPKNISYNKIYNVSPLNGGDGIDLFNNSDHSLAGQNSGFTVNHNEIYGGTSYFAAMWLDVANSEISYNDIHDNSQGIMLQDATGNTVNYNVIENCKGAPLDAVGGGLILYGTDRYNTNFPTVYGCKNNTIQYNIIGTTGKGNDIGIHLTDLSDLNTISNNFMNYNVTGIKLTAFSPGRDPGNGNTINDNDISLNTGLAINNTTAAQLDAECNWFGYNDLAQIAPLVSGTADYIPWLTTDGYTAPGFTPTGTCSGNPTISGTLKYNNPAKTLMTSVLMSLRTDPNPLNGTTITTATTGTDGNYTFNDIGIDLGTYYIVPNPNPKTPGSINSTDAAQVNTWGTGGGKIEAVKFLAGDVSWIPITLSGKYYVSSPDAQAIQKQYVYGSGYIMRDLWSYYKADKYVISNADPTKPTSEAISVTVSNANLTGVNLYGQVTGDFNGSYLWSGGKDGNANVNLTYGDTKQIGAGTETGLPVYIVNASELSAISLTFSIPTDKMEVLDVTMKDNNGQLDWAVIGDELRIGWNSVSALSFSAGEELLVIKLRTGDNFVQGESIRLDVTPDPINELADAKLEVIPGAELSINVLESNTLGLPDQPEIENLSLACYPNPFANYTMIKYTLPSEGRVILEICNVLGLKVATVVDEFQPGGTYTYKLDSTPLQPGVYTATIKLDTNGNDLVKTIKLVRQR